GQVPPPQDFSCALLDVVIDPKGPADPAGADVIVGPVELVLLKWTNPVSYVELVITRDNDILAKLDGSAMVYQDIAPPAGEHIYGIFGIAADGSQSRAVYCKIIVGGSPVPPVTDLQCIVSQPVDPTTNKPAGSVILVWKNAAKYDEIVINRNGATIA